MIFGRVNFMIKNIIKSRKINQTSFYQPTITTTKKARQIFIDLHKNHNQTKMCLGCSGENFSFDAKTGLLFCSNKSCINRTQITDPLAKCNLKDDEIETFLCMIIDLKQVDEIVQKLKVSRAIVIKTRNRFLDQINWSKFKLEKDVLDIREIYGHVNWCFY